MLDLIFLVAVAALLVLTMVWTRSASLTALLVSFSFALTGTVVQFAATFGVGWTRTSLSAWVLVAFAGSAVAALLLRRRHSRPVPRPSLRILITTAAILALLLALTRWLAPADLLQSVGYLINQPGAEDNAKWLNTSAQLASDAPVTTYSAVGGPLLLLMTLASGIVAALSTLLFGGVNEVAMSANAILVSQALLIVVTPFALAPLLEARFSRWTGAGERVRAVLPYPVAAVGVVLLTSASLLLTQYGHLTLQFVLISFTLWVAFFAMGMRRSGALVLTTLTVAMTAQVWFPTSALAVVLLLGLIAWSVTRVLRPETRRSALVVGGTSVVVLVMMNDFLRSSLAYSISSSSTTAAATAGGALRGVIAVFRPAAEPTIAIFGSPGGTEILTTTFIALLAVSLVAVYSMTAHGRITRDSVLPFLPAILLLGFACAVILLDFWSVGKGPGYASNKMLFATGITVLAVFLPLALLRLDPAQKRSTATRWAAVIVIAFLLIADSFLPRATARLKPALFPVAGDPVPYWGLAEVKPQADQPLQSNPLGCVFLPQGAERPSALPDGQLAYSCSRILAGLGGAGESGGSFVAWQLDEWLQNTSYWDYYQPALSTMPDDVRARNVIILDADRNVTGLVPFQSLLDRYPADPDYQR